MECEAHCMCSVLSFSSSFFLVLSSWFHASFLVPLWISSRSFIVHFSLFPILSFWFHVSFLHSLVFAFFSFIDLSQIISGHHVFDSLPVASVVCTSSSGAGVVSSVSSSTPSPDMSPPPHHLYVECHLEGIVVEYIIVRFRILAIPVSGSSFSFPQRASFFGFCFWLLFMLVWDLFCVAFFCCFCMCFPFCSCLFSPLFCLILLIRCYYAMWNETFTFQIYCPELAVLAFIFHAPTLPSTFPLSSSTLAFAGIPITVLSRFLVLFVLKSPIDRLVTFSHWFIDSFSCPNESKNSF